VVLQQELVTEQVKKTKLTSGVVKDSKYSYFSLPPVPEQSDVEEEPDDDRPTGLESGRVKPGC
jgi:hypothetical protein